MNPCQNESCTSGLPIEKELVCSTCWNVVCEDQNNVDIYRQYQDSVIQTMSDERLSPDEKADATSYQRYNAEAEFLSQLSNVPNPVSVPKPSRRGGLPPLSPITLRTKN